MPDICSKIGCLLYDAQNSVRECAIETLVSLYEVFGSGMLEELRENENIRPSQMESLQDAIYAQSSPQHGDLNKNRIKSDFNNGVCDNNSFHDLNGDDNDNGRHGQGSRDGDEGERHRSLNRTQGLMNISSNGNHNLQHSGPPQSLQSSKGSPNENAHTSSSNSSSSSSSSSNGHADNTSYDAGIEQLHGGQRQKDNQRENGREIDTGRGSNRNGPSREEKKSGPHTGQKGPPGKGRMSLAGIH